MANFDAQRLAGSRTDAATATQRRGVTLVSSVRLRRGSEAAHRRIHHEGVRAARALGGLERAELLPSIGSIQPDTVALFTFASRADLDRWISSPERQHVLDRMAPLVTSERTLNVIGGFAGWFAADTSRSGGSKLSSSQPPSFRSRSPSHLQDQ